MKQSSPKSLVRASMVAALYTVMTLISSAMGLAYGPVQFRISEVLTILPALSGEMILPLTFGCLLSNLVGLFTGNPIGLPDLIFGTLATFLGALLTWMLRKIRWFGLPVLSSLAPVIFNALIVGLELSIFLNGQLNAPVFLSNALSVGVGELVICVGLGLPFWKLLLHDRRLFKK